MSAASLTNTLSTNRLKGFHRHFESMNIWAVTTKPKGGATKLFIVHRTDPSTLTVDCETPLLWAKWNGYMRVLEVIEERGEEESSIRVCEGYGKSK